MSMAYHGQPRHTFFIVVVLVALTCVVVISFLETKIRFIGQGERWNHRMWYLFLCRIPDRTKQVHVRMYLA